MNILYYIPNLNQESGGIKQYCTNLLSTLKEIDQYNFYIFCNKPNDILLKEIKISDNLFLIPSNVSKEFWYQRYMRLLNQTWSFISSFWYKKDFEFESYINRAIRKYQISIVHCPVKFTPYTTKAPIICTIHDIQDIIMPENFHPRERAKRAWNYFDYLNRASAIVCSYEHIKRDISKYFDFKEKSNIHVVDHDMNNSWIVEYINKNSAITDEKDFEYFLISCQYMAS